MLLALGEVEHGELLERLMRERAGAAVLQQRDDLLEHETGDDHRSRTAGVSSDGSSARSAAGFHNAEVTDALRDYRQHSNLRRYPARPPSGSALKPMVEYG